MECPNCHHKGNLLKRPFVKRKGLPDRYCVNCGAQIKVHYHYGKIALLVGGIFLLLILIHLILLAMGYPGVNSGMAGGLTGAFLVIFMQRKPFVDLEHIQYKKSKKKK